MEWILSARMPTGYNRAHGRDGYFGHGKEATQLTEGQTTRRFRMPSLSMLGMLIAITLIVLVVGIPILLVSAQQRRALAARQTMDIACAAEVYQVMLHTYPPNTGQIDLSTGSTIPFTSGLVDEADAVVRYLGTTRTIPGPPPSTVGPMLLIHPSHIKTVNGLKIMVDPWGNPYRVEIFNGPGSPQIRVLVWSLGPDGKEGPVPFSRVKEITDPRDQDNICNWL